MKFFFAFLLLPFSLHATAFPTDAEALATLKKAFQGKGEVTQRTVKRTGDKTLEVECLISMWADPEHFRKIVPDFPTWRNWALVDINQAPPGTGDYLLQVHDLVPKSEGLITAQYSFNLPFLKKGRARSFKTSHVNDPKTVTLIGETILNEKSAVKSAKAFLKAMPAEGKPGMMWVMIKSVVQFKSWFLYEALPEKVVLREVGDRLQILVHNYQKEEARLKEGAPVAKRESTAERPASEYNEDL